MAINHDNPYLQIKYLQLVSGRFRNFKRQSGNQWNFSCPFCDDSKTHQKKARAYVLPNEKTPGYYFYCHNCGESMGVHWMVRKLDQGLYNQYVLELLGDQGEGLNHKPVPKPTPKPKFQPRATSKGLVKLSKLPPGHPAKIYVCSRFVPANQHYRLFFAPNFKEFVQNNMPEKMERAKEEPRLVIPFISKEKKLIGFQGRSLGDSQPKYITIMIDTDEPRIFGMERVNPDNDIIVTEGPIDALFLDNAIATAGGDIAIELGKTFFSKSKIIVVYDNEPRSEHTIKKMEKAIAAGYKICIWPSTYQEKDVNDMILRMVGKSNRQEVIEEKCQVLHSVIRSNSFHGMEATLKMSQWRKI